MSPKVGPKPIAISTVKTAAPQATQTARKASAADLAVLDAMKTLVAAPPPAAANAREVSTFTPAVAQKVADDPNLSPADNAIQQAFRRVTMNDTRTTTPAEFEKYRKAAQERLDKGMSKKDVMHEIANMIRQDGVGGGKADPRAAIDQAFKRVAMNDSRPTTDAEYAKYTKAAQERADKGMSQKDIMHDIANMIRADQAGGGAPPEGQKANARTAIDEAFKRVFMNSSRPTTDAEYARYTKAAQERADKGMSQKDIMHDIANMIRADQAGGGAPPEGQKANARTAIDEAFKRVFMNSSRPTTDAEYAKYTKAAQERADKGMSQKDIMHDIANMIRADQAGGGAPPEGQKANARTAIDEAFKRVFMNTSRPTTDAEYAKYTKAAQERADKGMSQKDIMHDIANMIRADQAGGGAPPEGQKANARTAIDEAFKRVFMNTSRPTTDAEYAKYTKAAQERADKGMSQKDIMHDIANMIRQDQQ